MMMPFSVFSGYVVDSIESKYRATLIRISLISYAIFLLLTTLSCIMELGEISLILGHLLANTLYNFTNPLVTCTLLTSTFYTKLPPNTYAAILSILTELMLLLQTTMFLKIRQFLGDPNSCDSILIGQQILIFLVIIPFALFYRAPKLRELDSDCLQKKQRDHSCLEKLPLILAIQR